MPKNCLNDKKGRTTMEMLNQKNLSSLVFSESRLNKELKNIKWNILGHVYEPIIGGDQQSSFAWISNDPAGTFVPPHMHPVQDEHAFILEGEYSLYLDGEWTTAKAGDYLYWPRGTTHGYKVTSAGPAKGVFWVSPGNDLASLFSELHNLTDPEKVVQVSAARNIRFIDPARLPNCEF